MVFEQHYPYDVTISYAGEDRDYANALADALRLRGIKVFYDKYEKAALWGKNLYDHLSDVYENKARYCVMFLSKHYAAKLWTNHERKAAQERAFGENAEYILPIRLDNTEIPGIPSTIAYLSWPPETAESIADAVVEKLGTGSKAIPLQKQPLTPKSNLSSDKRQLGNEIREGSPESVRQYGLIIDAYKQVVVELSSRLRWTTLVDLANNQNKLSNYEKQIIDIIANIERLGKSPLGWSFQKSKVIQNLEKAQEELGQVQSFLTYRTSDPQVAVEGLKHIHPCRRYLDVAASLMDLRKIRHS